jgi:hypothetical protein
LTVVKSHDVTEEFNPGVAVGSKYDISTFALQGSPETLHGALSLFVNHYMQFEVETPVG